MVGNELFPESKSSSDTGLIDFLALYFFANIYQLGRCYIEVARWQLVYQIYLPAI